MHRKLWRLLFMGSLCVPALAGAVTEADFEAKTTRNLLNLCTVLVDDPHAKEAVHFCQGYLVGAYDYHITENAGPDGKLLVCLPTPPPSRNTAVSMFVKWAQAQAQAQYLDERPVETEFRFLSEQWPCKH